MPRKASSKMNTVLNETATDGKTYVEVITAEPKKTAKKAATKTEPEKDLDWRPIGLVKEHRSAKVRAARKIERIRLEHLAYTASAFVMGMSIGVMIFSWLH